jgi:hypothetical protein
VEEIDDVELVLVALLLVAVNRFGSGSFSSDAM